MSICHGRATRIRDQEAGCTRVCAPEASHDSVLLAHTSNQQAVMADSTGAAVAQPVLLPEPPVALALSGGFLLAVGEVGLSVHDVATAALVQSIPWAHDDAWAQVGAMRMLCWPCMGPSLVCIAHGMLIRMPVQCPCQVSNAMESSAASLTHHHASLRNSCHVHPQAAQRLPCAEDTRSGRVLLATSSTVYCLSPVPLEAQARELLKRRQYSAALQLAGTHAEQAWVGAAMAQAGLLMLQVRMCSDRGSRACSHGTSPRLLDDIHGMS